MDFGPFGISGDLGEFSRSTALYYASVLAILLHSYFIDYASILAFLLTSYFIGYASVLALASIWVSPLCRVNMCFIPCLPVFGIGLGPCNCVWPSANVWTCIAL